MKKLICMLLACVMLLSCASAAPRLPQKNGAVVDDAAVLSQQTAEEVAKLHQLVKKDTDVELYLVTVDFLDGYSLDAYGDHLMEAWDAGDDALIVLLAVGEDKCTIFSGKNVKVSPSVQQKAVSTKLNPPFLAQSYDEAVSSLMPMLVTELNKAYGVRITLDGLFGVQEEKAAVDWVERLTREAAASRQREQEALDRRMEQEEDDDGISLGKIILTFLFLSMIFGSKKDGRRGCGCAPFAGLFGLWKLWKRD